MPHSGQRSSGAELAVGSTLLLLLLLLLALSSTRSYLSSRPFPEHASSSSKTQRTARPEGLRAKIWRRSAPLPALRPLCNERFYSSNLRVSSGSSSMEPAVRQISFQKAGSLIREAGEKVEYVAVKMASFQMTAESPLTLNAGGSALARAGDDLSRAESGTEIVAPAHYISFDYLDACRCENLELLADTLENLAESLGMESYSEARAHVEVAADTVEQIGESIQEYSSYFGGAPGNRSPPTDPARNRNRCL
eukprot:jgi/Bigna1/70605/fgenesh1_pg.12_\